MVRPVERSTGDRMVRDSPVSLCCVLEQDTLSVLCSGSTQEDRKLFRQKIVDRGVKKQHKQNQISLITVFFA